MSLMSYVSYVLCPRPWRPTRYAGVLTVHPGQDDALGDTDDDDRQGSNEPVHQLKHVHTSLLDSGNIDPKHTRD